MCQLDHEPATMADHVACHLVKLLEFRNLLERGDATSRQTNEAMALAREVIGLLNRSPEPTESDEKIREWLEPLLARLEGGTPSAA
jgi:hypothetical protein